MRLSIPCAVLLAGAGLTLAPAAPAADKLAGYAVTSSGLQLAPAGAQTRGTALCPTGTVPLSGGASISTSRLEHTINSSFPSQTSNGWSVDVNNGGLGPTTFTVFAVCAKAPKLYQVLTLAGQTAPAGGQGHTNLTCPRGTVAFGGGAVVGSSSLALSLNSSAPFERDWQLDVANASPTATSFTSFELCGKKPRGFVAVSAGAVNPPGASSSVSAFCPSGTLPIGGGSESSALGSVVTINSSLPLTAAGQGGWSATQNNGSGGQFSVSAFALCATT